MTPKHYVLYRCSKKINQNKNYSFSLQWPWTSRKGSEASKTTTTTGLNTDTLSWLQVEGASVLSAITVRTMCYRNREELKIMSIGSSHWSKWLSSLSFVSHFDLFLAVSHKQVSAVRWCQSDHRVDSVTCWHIQDSIVTDAQEGVNGNIKWHHHFPLYRFNLCELTSASPMSTSLCNDTQAAVSFSASKQATKPFPHHGLTLTNLF